MSLKLISIFAAARRDEIQFAARPPQARDEISRGAHAPARVPDCASQSGPARATARRANVRWRTLGAADEASAAAREARALPDPKAGGVLLIILLLVSGCAHYPRNARLLSSDIATGYRFRHTVAPTNSADLLLMLAFSGGGTRAASLSFGVLEELARTSVGSDRAPHRMLDEVDIISSVSGGSFTAAYYALWGDRIFSDFETKFLKREVQSDLRLRVLAPWHQVRLASSKFGRSDLAAEYYDDLLFQGATFGDLMARRSRPFLCINATDVASGARFEFTQDEFDLIGSDLAQFPISRAVAASSAFPIVLTPVVLKNYSAEQPKPAPEWIKAILENPTASTRMKYMAAHARSYGDESRRFIHLLDGGLSDNLGLRGALDRAIAREQFAPVPSVPWQLPRRVALIVVDAHTDSDYGWDSKEHSLGQAQLLGSLGHVAVSHYSFETLELFREVMARLAREHTGSSDSVAVETYVIELHFSQLADESDRRFFNAVPTSLQLPLKTVDRLRQLAARELAGNAEFQRLCRDLGGDLKAGNWRQGCRQNPQARMPALRRSAGIPARGFTELSGSAFLTAAQDSTEITKP